MHLLRQPLLLFFPHGVEHGNHFLQVAMGPFQFHLRAFGFGRIMYLSEIRDFFGAYELCLSGFLYRVSERRLRQITQHEREKCFAIDLDLGNRCDERKFFAIRTQSDVH